MPHPSTQLIGSHAEAVGAHGITARGRVADLAAPLASDVLHLVAGYLLAEVGYLLEELHDLIHVHAYVEQEGREGEAASVFLKPSGYTGTSSRGGEPGSNGLVLDSVGRLVLCQHGDRRVVRVEKDGRWTTLVDRYKGKRLNSPNDAVFKSNGDLYFTDPPYGLQGEDRKTLGELGFCGVYRLATDNRLTLLTDQMTRPNGIAFSPDEKTLYVANSDPKRAVWMAFDVTDDGLIAHGRVLYDATAWVGKRKGLPDGMTVDRSGNLFATGPGGVNVFAPDGTFLGRIDPGEATANCTFGDDGSTLYVTADMVLCRIKSNTKGLGF